MGIHLIGEFDTDQSVSEATRLLVHSLKESGVPFVFSNIRGLYSSSTPSLESNQVFRPEYYPIHLIALNADASMRLYEKLPNLFHASYTIGYWVWELDTFPDIWEESLFYLDEIWAPSTFVLEGLSNIATIPVKRIPYVYLPQYNKLAFCRQDFGLPDHTFIALLLFDFRSGFARKNPLAALEAFSRAFGDRKDVLFVIKTLPGEAHATERESLRKAMSGRNNMRLFDEFFEPNRLLGLLSVCDVYLSLHRSEGFGLPLLNAMGLGKPVVATNYSGNTDFMSAVNSFPVNFSLVTSAPQGLYFQKIVWAEPDIDHAAQLLRDINVNHATAKSVAENGAKTVREHFSPAAVGKMIHARMNELCSAYFPGHGRAASDYYRRSLKYIATNRHQIEKHSNRSRRHRIASVIRKVFVRLTDPILRGRRAQYELMQEGLDFCLRQNDIQRKIIRRLLRSQKRESRNG